MSKDKIVFGSASLACYILGGYLLWDLGWLGLLGFVSIVAGAVLAKAGNES